MNYAKTMCMSAAVAISAGALFLAASPAFGQQRPIFVYGSEDVLVRHISYADLNLASAAGERTLNHRVGGAVSDLCTEATGGDDGSTDFKFSMVRCSRVAWNGARPQISQAVRRAQELAATGSTSIPVAALTITLPK